MQNWCQAQITEKSDSKILMDSFLCGARVQDIHLRELFLQTGLIHLLVVSGGHFAFLIASLDFFSKGLSPAYAESKILKLINIILLVAFSLMTGFQAPVVRALMSLSLQTINWKLRWNWDQSKIQLFSGLFILALIPDWIFSLSFYLSWLTSMGLCFVPLWLDGRMVHKKSWRNQILKWLSTCLLIQCLVGLFFWQFSWMSFLMNLFVAPLLMLLLWPLAIVLVLFPFAYPAVDLIWNFIFRFLNFFLVGRPAPEIDFSQIHWGYLWALIIFFHACLEIMTRKRFQNHYV